MSKAGSIGAALVVIAVLIGIFGGLWSYAGHLVNEQQKALDEGCDPLTFNSWGIATAYRCPEGVDINND